VRRLFDAPGLLIGGNDSHRNRRELSCQGHRIRPGMPSTAVRNPAVCESPVQRTSMQHEVLLRNPPNRRTPLADRAMSRLLKEDWPRSLDEMEKHFESRKVK
jgi:hypothetical protein